MTDHNNNPLHTKIIQPSNQVQKSNLNIDKQIKKQQQNQALQNVGKHGKSHHLYMKVMNEHKPVTQLRKITLEQLSLHNSAESAWLSLNGVVYDVTVYLNFHPGGEILLKGCGQQCANLFNKYHPWVNAKHLLQKYTIGHLSYY